MNPRIQRQALLNERRAQAVASVLLSGAFCLVTGGGLLAFCIGAAALVVAFRLLPKLP